jgi:hypothetical protein
MTGSRSANEARKGVARLATMPRPLVFLLSLALGAGIAVVLVSCGGDDEEGEIPPDNASVMLAALQDAEGATDCEAVENAATSVANEAAGLPESEARTGVIDGAENLAELARNGEGCQTGPTGPEGPQDDTTTTTTPPPTETTTTTTEPEEEEDERPERPDEDDDGGDNGGDNGGGPPGGTPPGQGGEPPGGGGGPPETGGEGAGGLGDGDDD